MTWVLVLFVHAGVLSNADSMALTTVPGFKLESACQAAGIKSQALAQRTTKEVSFVCVQQD